MDATRDFDRARIYRALARVFRPPEPDLLETLRSDDLGELRACLRRLDADDSLLRVAMDLAETVSAASFESLTEEWDAQFDPAGGLPCSPNETSHTARTSQEAWLKTYRIADIAGFYRAFGVEVQPGSEKADHIGVELEFMHLLATKTAAARARGNEEQAGICDDAARAFLADHLGQWCTDLVDSLRATGKAAIYLQAGEFLRDFVAHEQRQLGPPGREESGQPLVQEPRTFPRPTTTK